MLLPITTTNVKKLEECIIVKSTHANNFSFKGIGINEH
jgi:hypothetical protein